MDRSEALPPLLERKVVAKWRLDLFYHRWGENQNRINSGVLDWYGAPRGSRYGAPLRQYIRRHWLVAKTRAIVESDRLLMPDGTGAIKRVMHEKPPCGP